MAAADHIISREKVAIRYRGKMRVQELHRGVRQTFEERLPERLSQVFDSIAGPEEWVRIERMQINLTMNEAKLQPEELSALIAHRIEQEIKSHTSADIASQAIRQTFSDALQHYLLHGYIPWWAADADEWHAIGIAKLADRAQETRAMLTPVLKFADACKRLLALFGYHELESLLVAVFNWPADFTRSVSADFKILQSLFHDQILSAAFQTDWHIALLQAAKEEQVREEEVLKTLAAIFFVSLEKLSSIPALELEKAAVILSQPALVARPVEIIAALPQKVSPALSKEVAQIKTETAGLCIISSFLPRCFSELGILDAEGGLCDKPKAVKVLRYLAGANQNSEHEGNAVFEKILCGIPLVEAIVPLPNLNKEEMSEADALLEAVISHWPALKQTSPAGLREGFLQRTGMLIRNGNNWVLRVQSLPQDVLLDRLPWRHRMIRTPWMDGLVTVEW